MPVFSQETEKFLNDFEKDYDLPLYEEDKEHEEEEEAEEQDQEGKRAKLHSRAGERSFSLLSQTLDDLETQPSDENHSKSLSKNGISPSMDRSQSQGVPKRHASFSQAIDEGRDPMAHTFSNRTALPTQEQVISSALGDGSQSFSYFSQPPGQRTFANRSFSLGRIGPPIFVHRSQPQIGIGGIHQENRIDMIQLEGRVLNLETDVRKLGDYLGSMLQDIKSFQENVATANEEKEKRNNNEIASIRKILDGLKEKAESFASQLDALQNTQESNSQRLFQMSEALLQQFAMLRDIEEQILMLQTSLDSFKQEMKETVSSAILSIEKSFERNMQDLMRTFKANPVVLRQNATLQHLSQEFGYLSPIFKRPSCKSTQEEIFFNKNSPEREVFESTHIELVTINETGTPFKNNNNKNKSLVKTPGYRSKRKLLSSRKAVANWDVFCPVYEKISDSEDETI